MTSHDPIRLSQFRTTSARTGMQAIDRQFRLSFGLTAFLATAAVVFGALS